MADRPVPLLPPRRTASALLIALGCIAAWSAPLAGSDPRQTPIVRAVQSAGPSVVDIQGEKTLGAAAAQAAEDDAERRVNGMGTGVVIDSRGYILTNHHVIDGVREIHVTLADGSLHIGRLIERDSSTDLAIIKIDPAKPLPEINIGISKDLMPGESVVAVGNAYGYEHTITQGIISALHRAVHVSDSQYYDDLIQTDASINPGNSGGPLLNINGEMIGINVAVRAGAQGIGFAIPVDKAMAVAADLMATCGARRSWHGVDLSSDESHDAEGLSVKSVAQASPAEEAGLQPGDVIAAADDVRTARVLDFHRAVVEVDPGDDVDLLVRRGDDTLKLTLKMAKAAGSLKSQADPYWQLLGLRLKPIPTEGFQQKYRTRYRGGLSVDAVRPRSPAANQGIRQGDVLVGMHIWETISLENLDYVMSRPDLASINPVKFFILRGNQTFWGHLSIPVAMRNSRQR